MYARFADINYIALQETVHEFEEPGSGIGKFGDYPARDDPANSLNRDNIRPPGQNLDSPSDLKRRMDSVEAENRSLQSQLEARSAIERVALDMKEEMDR